MGFVDVCIDFGLSRQDIHNDDPALGASFFRVLARKGINYKM
jgi:hypothetical protein